VLATLIRLLGDFDLAEEARQDAFEAALEQWPARGIPANPSAWLIGAGRRRHSLRDTGAIDARGARRRCALGVYAIQAAIAALHSRA
jgi:predicted RNA polymerase sigma factor